MFFRSVEGSNKVWTSKTSLSVSRQDFVEHVGRVISTAKQPEILHLSLLATNDLLSESPNSIFGISFFLRETMNSLRGTNKLVGCGQNLGPGPWASPWATLWADPMGYLILTILQSHNNFWRDL